jgi:uncharacterized protein YjiS (DUF1127 family)
MAQIAHNPGMAALGQDGGHSAAKTPVLTVARRVIATWSSRRRSRIALSHLTSAQLRDIGLEGMIAAEEAARPFWQP